MATTFGLSDPGNRKVNEDACYFESKLGLAIVCDGISAHGGGDLASALAIDAIKNYLHSKWSMVEDCRLNASSERRHGLAGLLHEALAEASKNIFQQAHANSNTVGMCTTVDVLLLAGTHAILGHVGSGRCYLFRENSLHLISEDHTQLAEMKKKGKAPPTGMDENTLSKKITRAVGHHEQVRADVLEIELMAGDKFFLCTDGVWGSMPAAKLLTYLKEDSPQSAVQAMMSALKQVHPKDNYTALVVQPDYAVPMEQQEKSLTAAAKIKLAGNIPIFQYLAYPELIKLMSISELFKVKAGHVVCKEGDPGEEMMVILAGKLNVMIQGKKIAELSAGQAVGEMSMIEGGARSASLVAAENTNLVAFSRKALFEMLREETELCVKFLWGLTEEINRRLRTTSNQLAGKGPVAPKSITKASELLPFIFNKEL